MPRFSERSNNGRFGFHVPIVPAGTEPDNLQVLNNPYVAEQRAKKRHPAAQDINKHLPPALQHRSVSNSSGVSDVTRRLPQLSCTGRQASSHASQRGRGMVNTHIENEEADEGSGVEGGKEDSEDDEEEGLEDGEHPIRLNSGLKI